MNQGWMKAGPFTYEPIVAIQQEAGKGEQAISGRCRSKGISETTFYTWCKKFGGMAVRIEGWRRYWNEKRLHCSQGYRILKEFVGVHGIGHCSVSWNLRSLAEVGPDHGDWPTPSRRLGRTPYVRSDEFVWSPTLSGTRRKGGAGRDTT